MAGVTLFTNSLRAVGFSHDTRTRTRIGKFVLDHIFVGKLNLEQAKVWDGMGGSDHKALTVDLVVEE